jgi:hypothetical protein
VVPLIHLTRNITQLHTQFREGYQVVLHVALRLVYTLGLETGENTLRNAEHTKRHHMCDSPSRQQAGPATHVGRSTLLCFAP